MIQKLKKLLKVKKTLASLMAVFVGIMLFNPLVANASTLKVTNKYNKLSYLSFANGEEHIFFPMKVLVGTNEPVYCLEHAKLTPQGEVYTGKGYLDGGIRYILAQNTNTGSSNKDYYIKQAAVHYYLGQIPELNRAKNTPVKRAILDLVSEAKAHKNDDIVPGLSMADKTVDFKYYPSKDTYETDWIYLKTSGDVSKFQSSLSHAPEGVEIVLPGGKVVNNLGKNDTKFFLRIARDKVKSNFTMKMSFRAIFKVTKVQKFVPRDSKYQKIAYPQLVEVAGNDSANLTAELNKVYGKLEVVKKGDNGKLLDGAKFSLYKEDGKTKVADGVTNKDGKLLFSNLDQGTYILREDQAPTGYVVNVKDTTIKVVVDKTTTTDVVNKEIKGRIKVTKIDEETGAKLAGAKFEIKDKTTGKVLETLTTDNQGEAISNYYNYGTQVIIKEVKAPAKYTLNGKEYVATITENMKTIEIKVPDRIIKGTISIHKVDKETKKPLAGVEFYVLDSNKNTVETLTTDKDGNAKTKELNYGKYTIVEAKANKYYNLNEKAIDVNITENKDYSYTVENVPTTGKLLIKKVDIATGKEIEGAKINITCVEGLDKGKVIEFISGKTAKEFDLKAGKYTYEEVTAPKGYELNKEIGQFEITKEGQIVECSVKDKAIEKPAPKVELPHTGYNATIAIIVASILVLVGVILVLNKKNNKK